MPLFISSAQEWGSSGISVGLLMPPDACRSLCLLALFAFCRATEFRSASCKQPRSAPRAEIARYARLFTTLPTAFEALEADPDPHLCPKHLFNIHLDMDFRFELVHLVHSHWNPMKQSCASMRSSCQSWSPLGIYGVHDCIVNLVLFVYWQRVVFSRPQEVSSWLLDIFVEEHTEFVKLVANFLKLYDIFLNPVK